MKLIVVSAVVGLAFAPSLAGAQCKKWNAQLSMCQTNPSTCVSGAPPATFGQLRYYYSKLYKDTAQQACESAFDYHPTYANAYVVAVPITATQVGCQLDTSGNGDIDVGTSEEDWAAVLYLDDVPRESICERTPNGPYKSLGMTGIDGQSFTSAQRTSIRNHNLRELGTLRSDAGPARPPQTVPNECDSLTGGTESSWIWSYDDDVNWPQIKADCVANVDHIIPRKDIYGCDCGPNSFANALVIGWKLNRKMSNNSQDDDRQAIIDRWTLP